MNVRQRHDQLQKVSVIFETFDADRDGKLSKAELTILIQRCNPSVAFSQVQLNAITDEVSCFAVENLCSKHVMTKS